MNRISRLLHIVGDCLRFAPLCVALCAASAEAASRLPDGYTEVQYIQGDGKSRIEMP